MSTEVRIPIVLEESAGIARCREPVTMGLPLPPGLTPTADGLVLVNPGASGEALPVQGTPLAFWPDGSVKWVLLDFQATVPPSSRLQLELTLGSCGRTMKAITPIAVRQEESAFVIDTGEAAFWVNRTRFMPFERIVRGNAELLSATGSWTRLVDAQGIEHLPLIDTIAVESGGPLRTTLKVTGRFRKLRGADFATFVGRLHFFAESALVSLEFTVQNPRAARHPGGLWDLGDAGSIHFRDLSLAFRLNSSGTAPETALDLVDESEPALRAATGCDGSPGVTPTADMLVYQDSSGGINWQSRNHVNKDGVVRTSFQGYAVFKKGVLLSRGCRAAPVLTVRDQIGGISGTIRHFWQNFPSAIEAEGGSLVLRVFPGYFSDCFELQGGEQKTHTLLLHFHGSEARGASLAWTRRPLLPRSTPEWYAGTKAVPFLVPRSAIPPGPVHGLLDTAVDEERGFVRRRETIDEYGWRNFGDFYADHEAVGHTGAEAFISHYNNQYDGLWGCLIQFLSTSDVRWFLLGDQLAAHVKDIDIYHTDRDRPEYNHGMFWHTDHYINAETATHRCYSRKHAPQRNLAHYGGGPSLSHNYSSGLLLHHYLTGSPSSREALLELAQFVSSNCALEQSVLNDLATEIKKVLGSLKRGRRSVGLAETKKVYNLDGPGRASGNALNTLVDAFRLSEDPAYLEAADRLISSCVSSKDDIDQRDLLNAECRWSYTIFLQSLGKFLDVCLEAQRQDGHWQEARRSLVHYAEWMLEREVFFLDQRESLEYPNETWPAQELRKAIVLLYGGLYGDQAARPAFLAGGSRFMEGGVRQILSFETRSLVRPSVLLLQNVPVFWCLSSSERQANPGLAAPVRGRFVRKLSSALRNEFLFIKSWQRRL